MSFLFPARTFVRSAPLSAGARALSTTSGRFNVNSHPNTTPAATYTNSRSEYGAGQGDRDLPAEKRERGEKAVTADIISDAPGESFVCGCGRSAVMLEVPVNGTEARAKGQGYFHLFGPRLQTPCLHHATQKENGCAVSKSAAWQHSSGNSLVGLLTGRLQQYNASGKEVGTLLLCATAAMSVDSSAANFI